nr:tripartite tricarboxylate transporter permease [Aneurinibacillus tyrosinisolvens]
MNLAKPKGQSTVDAQKIQGSLRMTREDWRRSVSPYGRGSVLGFLHGVLPGIGPTLSSFASYVIERKLSKHPNQFGKGAIEGVAGPETANNAAVGGAPCIGTDVRAKFSQNDECCKWESYNFR